MNIQEMYISISNDQKILNENIVSDSFKNAWNLIKGKLIKELVNAEDGVKRLTKRIEDFNEDIEKHKNSIKNIEERIKEIEEGAYKQNGEKWNKKVIQRLRTNMMDHQMRLNASVLSKSNTADELRIFKGSLDELKPKVKSGQIVIWSSCIIIASIAISIMIYRGYKKKKLEEAKTEEEKKRVEQQLESQVKQQMNIARSKIKKLSKDKQQKYLEKINKFEKQVLE